MKKNIGIAVLALLLAGAGGYVFVYGMPDLLNGTGVPGTETLDTASGTPEGDSVEVNTEDLSECATLPDKALLTSTLSVSWSRPVQRSDIDLKRRTPCFHTYESGETVIYDSSGARSTWSEFYDEEASIGEVTYYSVGTVSGGLFDGGTVVLAVLKDGESYPHFGGFGMAVARMIYKDGRVTLLAASSQDFMIGLDPDRFVLDTRTMLPGIQLPERFSSNGMMLERPEYAADPDIRSVASVVAGTDMQGLYVAFTDPKFGPVYTDISGNDMDYAGESADIGFSKTRSGLYVRTPDSTYHVYAMAFPSWYNGDTHIANITWNDSTRASLEYVPTDYGGCGSTNYASVMKNLGPTDLAPAGKTASGDTVFTLANTSHPILKKLYSQYLAYQDIRADYAVEGEKAEPTRSYADFAARREIFFWRDPIGRLIKFQTNNYSLAECGKPVIYLYPEETITASVQVEPRGGMTISIPSYEEGWNVRATPDSVITDLRTGIEYPYLFWEGRGDLYETPKQGFVVAQNDVHDFLIDKLAMHGLNEKETADFLEFWEPRMTGSPYYFVTFLGTRAMDEIAPLTITPKPDTVIRVLMDYLPLDAPIDVEGYRIRTPERKGFTVIEWGGVLR
jgi:hypothetical protein